MEIVSKKQIRDFLSKHSVQVGKTPGIKDGIAKYNEIMNRVSSNDAVFKETFKKFYQLKFKPGSEEENIRLERYFELLNIHYLNRNIDRGIYEADLCGFFKEVVVALAPLYNRAELSFASKLLHTTNPTFFPIYDNIVGELHFGISRSSKKTLDERINDTAFLYRKYFDDFYAFCRSDEGKEIISVFKEVFQKELGEIGGLPDIKILDFVLWCDRPQEDQLFKKEWVSFVVRKQRIKELNMPSDSYSASLCKGILIAMNEILYSVELSLVEKENLSKDDLLSLKEEISLNRSIHKDFNETIESFVEMAEEGEIDAAINLLLTKEKHFFKVMRDNN